MGEPLAIPTSDAGGAAVPGNEPGVDLTQDTLLDRAIAGDRHALGLLLAQHQKRLYNTVLRMVSNADDAAEVTQDAMLKIVQHIGGFRRDAKLTTWMTRIAMNQAISHLRKRRTRDTVSLESSGRAAAESDDQAASLRAALADHREPTAEHRVETRDSAQRLQLAIDRLDDEFKAVLVLRDIDQLDYAEIAAALDLKVGTVKSRLFRARLAVREMLRTDTSAREDTGPAT
ncbi:MAG: sigma-70 family RNA polymerase sigma factor [Planctomycetota bacterium]